MQILLLCSTYFFFVSYINFKCIEKNKFDGSLPAELANMNHMIYIDVRKSLNINYFSIDIS